MSEAFEKTVLYIITGCAGILGLLLMVLLVGFLGHEIFRLFNWSCT